MACNCNIFIETKRLLTVTDIHVHCKSCIIFRMQVQDRDVVITEHEKEVIYGLSVSTTLSERHGHLPIVSLF